MGGGGGGGGNVRISEWGCGVGGRGVRYWARGTRQDIFLWGFFFFFFFFFPDRKNCIVWEDSRW